MRRKKRKRKSEFNWIRAAFLRGRLYPPRPTAKELDAFEKEFHVRLPASYRGFAERFGLGGRFHILPELLPLTPLPDQGETYWWHSVGLATRFHRSEEAIEIAPTDFLQRVVVFGIDEGENVFLFDTGEVTDPHLSEYRIFEIPRHEDPKPVAKSFVEWLRWIDTRYGPDEDEVEEETDEIIDFDPDASEPDPMTYVRTPLSMPD